MRFSEQVENTNEQMNNVSETNAQPLAVVGSGDQFGDCEGSYEKPVLVCYGDVRDVTLGPTPGFAESGVTGACRQPGGTPDISVCP